MLGLILTLVLVGVLLYCLNRFVPMDGTIKNIINIVVVLCVVIWLLNVFGVFGAMSNVDVPRINQK